MLGLLGSEVITAAPQGPLQPLTTLQYPFKYVTMDLVTHLPATDCSHDAIYTVVDKQSKFTYFIPSKHTFSAIDLAQFFLENIVACYGILASIVSNHDPRFTSHFQHILISALGYKYSLSTNFHPGTDGLSKRMHRSIEQILHCYASAQQGNWDLLLLKYDFALNSTCSASTRITPAYVVFGH